MKLLHATKNELKYNLMKERLKKFTNIELVNPKMLGINRSRRRWFNCRRKFNKKSKSIL